MLAQSPYPYHEIIHQQAPPGPHLGPLLQARGDMMHEPQHHQHQQGLDLTVDELDSREEADEMERLRMNYMASLDASIDLLMRNSLCSGLPGMSAMLTPNNVLPSTHSTTTISNGLLHWYQPPTLESHTAEVKAVPHNSNTTSTRSSQFTIEHIMRKE